MAKVKIFVQKPFIFSSESGEKIPFETGIQEVEKEIAEHWFVQAHSVAASDMPVEGANDKEVEKLKATIKKKDEVIKKLQDELKAKGGKNVKEPDPTDGDGVQG